MIVWGILTEQSIGQIFDAGVIPGLMLASLFIIYVFIRAVMNPSLVGGGVKANLAIEEVAEVSTGQFLISLFGIILVIVAVLGGIWFGFFTPTEGAGAGAFIGLMLGEYNCIIL